MKTSRIISYSLCSLVLIISGFAVFKPTSYGLDHVDLMEPYLNGKFPSTVPSGDNQWQVKNAFPNLLFNEPTAMVEIPGANKFLISGKQGQIWIFDNDSTASSPKLLLDLGDSTMGRSDAGLLDIALHPDFADSTSAHKGELYVFYTFTPDKSLIDPIYDRLSRFTVPPALDTIYRSSEEVIIQQFDHQEWHNGGCMFFDKDKYLYISVGDEGATYDAFQNSQKINKSLFSGLLRIDVDMDLSRSHVIRRPPVEPDDRPTGWPGNINNLYTIPNDNPWVDAAGRYLEEFFAIGLRSPHRTSYDTVTENIWVADVGQHSREEISLIKKGSNAQWAYAEGKQAGRMAKPDSLIGIETPPVFDYGRTEGNAIIGGFVYRGKKHPLLDGLYIFGDYVFGNIWTLNPDNNEVVLLCRIPDSSGRGLVTFSTDSEGEIYVIKLDGSDPSGGIIFKLKTLAETPDPPHLLSETGAFTDLSTLTPATGIIPYDVNSPLWSDGATKKRWVAIPNGAKKVDYFENSEWMFPKGTVFIKEFDLPTGSGGVKRIETRFLVVGDPGGVYGVTYQWNDEGTEAYLISKDEDVNKEIDFVDDQGLPQSQEWYFPTRGQCLTCHNSNAGFVLGVRTSQLNKQIVYPASGINDNQIRTWNHLGLFTETIDESTIAQLPKLVSLSDPAASDELKVRSYLDANCALCHRPGGVDAAFDARFSSPLKDQNIINATVIGHNSTPGNVIAKPKDLEHSELWVRDNSLEDNAMPPLAKHKLHDEYLSVLSSWILSLDTGVVSAIPKVPEAEKALSLTIYPNPFKSYCVVQISVNKKIWNSAVIRVYDLSGRIVYQNFNVPVGEKFVIKDKDWIPGVYILESSLGTLRTQTRIVKL